MTFKSGTSARYQADFLDVQLCTLFRYGHDHTLKTVATMRERDNVPSVQVNLEPDRQKGGLDAAVRRGRVPACAGEV